jgi:hypothetical protein
VKPVSGTVVPTGTVNSLDGSTFLGSVDLVSGTATFSTSSMAEATHTIVGTYLFSGPRTRCHGHGSL